MSDYSDFFTKVVTKHLHRLVDLVKNSHSQKVLVHEWVLGIEYNWSAYVTTSEDDGSEFIPRLSFWIGGLRDQFNSNINKNKVIELLYKTFDASTFCYFEYGARDDVEKQIEKYCKEVDDWFNEEILLPKLKKFRLSKDVIPLINSQIDLLQRYNSDLSDSRFGISKDIRDASGLEKEFSSIFKIISEEYVKVMKSNIEWFLDISENLKSFEKTCSNLGYREIVSKKQKSEIEEISKLIELKKTLKSIVNIHFDKIKIYEPNLPEPEKYSPFLTLFHNSLKHIKPEEILMHLYEMYLDILKRNPKQGNDIHANMNSFIKEISKENPVKQIEQRFNEIKDNASLKIKLINIFRMPKKEVQIILKHNSKKIGSKHTNIEGKSLFDNIPKDRLNMVITLKDKEKEYDVDIQEYYNEKEIWLFSL